MSRISRRDFARTTVIAAVAGAVQAEETAARPHPEAEARIAWLMGRYGDRFTEQQKKDIRDRITSGQAGLDAMRAYPLDNSVEPSTVFRVVRRRQRPKRVGPDRR